MFNPEKLLGNIVGQALGGAFGGGRGKKKSMFNTGNLASKATLGIGALGIAMAAYEHFSAQRSQSAATPAPPAPPLPTAAPAYFPPLPASNHGLPAAPPPPPAARDLSGLSEAAADSVLLVRTMIAAAAADGMIDADERQRILARTADGDLDAETRSFLEAELAVPKSADEIAAMSRPAQVNEVYAAALLAVNLDHDAERRFLERLGNGLGLSAETQLEIRTQLLA